MNKSILVSVIIPVYNVYPYLTECLESVLNQTYKNLEIIIVDDGSTDGSEKICDSYASKDPRIRLIHQKNQGVSAARNTGLDMMNGDVVAFLDSDDAYHPAFVEIMLDVLTKKQTDIVMCERVFCYTAGKMTAHLPEIDYEPTSCESYDKKSFFRKIANGFSAQSVWNNIYKNYLWKDIRFPVGHVYEDLDTTYKVLALCNTICVIDTPLYLYRKRPGSITETVSQKSISDCLLAKEHFLDFVEKNTPEIFTDEHLEKILRRHFRGMISLYGRYKKGSNDDPKFMKQLRNRIIETGSVLHIHSKDVSLKILDFLIRYCPFGIRVLYRIIYPLRNMILRFLNK